MANSNDVVVSGITQAGAGSIAITYGTLVAGAADGIEIAAAGIVVNGGDINGAQGSGVLIGAAGTVTNLDGATISGLTGGVVIVAAGDINNSGSIAGVLATGAIIGAAGTVTNAGGGTIDGATSGVSIAAAGIVTNAGNITGSQAFGAYIGAAGAVTNAGGGTINGATSGVSITAAGTITNAGNIASSQGSGSFIGAAGSVVNTAGGTISGLTYGVEIVAAGSLRNAGTIIGTTLGAVYFQTAGASLIVDPGAVFVGAVRVGGVGGGTIELTAGKAGALSGIGVDFTGFATVNIDPNAIWTIGGTLAGFQGVTINGFSHDDTLALTGLAAGDTATLGTDNLLTIANAQGLALGTLQFSGSVAGESFALVPDGHGGTSLLLCYLAQTGILTPSGEVAVEDLRIGDVVVTRWQGMQKIRWIGRQSFAAQFVRRNPGRIPVLIKAGALGERLPSRDLSVSPGHSMLLEHQLVLAQSLINGITITQDHDGSDIHYYQLELDTHDCVIANGTWSESYADCEGLREQFHNVAEFHALYPDHRPAEELTLCAPRPERGAKLDAALRPVVARAAAGLTTGSLIGSIDRVDGAWRIEGWAQSPEHPEMPVLLEILLGDEILGSVLACDYRQDLHAAEIGQGRCSFIFSSPVRLRPEALGTLRIRRAIDGAELPMSSSCRHAIAAATVPAKPWRLAA